MLPKLNIRFGEEIPTPDEVIGALTAFPPKLSILAKPLALPEEMFENMIRTATGIEVPPGPVKFTKTLMESFEAGAPALPVTPATVAMTPPAEEKPSGTQVVRGVGRIDVEVF